VSMENRMGRLPQISVRDVLNKLQLWKERYARR
jgi:hypothetical protein